MLNAATPRLLELYGEEATAADEELAATCEYDLYVLTKPDFPDVVDEGDADMHACTPSGQC